ncbi:tetratricopeptide repeat protein [Desulfoluna spongiiphila]|uniref:tetratricopeptide repeat protein n=1 Tax=Desulfoluna spongiiphila TaxID=419481 RepID=UPI0012564F29|nr:tetratricopeptide repeat protein [Desulfoluna spongiiphila]VVS91406.1 multihaem cytochrome [Desulfoluna spongiiphila]
MPEDKTMPSDLTQNRHERQRWITAGVIATLVIVVCVPLYVLKTEYLRRTHPQALPASPTFVGRQACISCHKPEYDKWLNSDHDQAMDVATDATVLGDFDNAVFTQNGITTRFYRTDDSFFVNTRGPDGKNGDFQVTHTFGVYPLQQYLVPFPGGRFQCLTIAWDVDKKQWYALPNHTDDSDDWLHWTKAAQNWNGMCAECHSTHLRKGYDHQTDTFNTTWTEIDVSCEACHGPGSAHVAWAEKPDMAREKTENYHLMVDTRDITPEAQLAICARCHSRRASFADFDHRDDNMMDCIIPTLLNDGLYHPDGQILDEVYVYGSFTQSKMYQRDVKCSDCHDVHSLKRKSEGNDLCLQCHRKDIYDTSDHHFHKATDKGKPSKGDDCTSCHMPETPYMGIDMRADHSIRIPRPDLSLALQTPNACNASGCHGDKTTQWSADWTKTWYGLRKRAHYGTVFAMARAGNPDAKDELIRLSRDQLGPPVVRATALSLLQRFMDDKVIDVLEESLSDNEALIRHTGIATLNLTGHEQTTRLITPLLYDPVKAVRIQAALSLAPVYKEQLSDNQKIVFHSAIREYREAMEYASDFASGRFNLGIMYDALGDTGQAIAQYREAIRIDAQFYPAKNNLAMLYNRTGNNKGAVALFQGILKDHPERYDMAYSLGLLLAEEKQYAEAAVYLRQAARGLPERSRIHYNLGLLLQHLGKHAEAEASLLTALSIEPDHADYLLALADHLIKNGRYDDAALVARAMIEKHPDNQTGYELLRYIRHMKERPQAGRG